MKGIHKHKIIFPQEKSQIRNAKHKQTKQEPDLIYKLLCNESQAWFDLYSGVAN